MYKVMSLYTAPLPSRRDSKSSGSIKEIVSKDTPPPLSPSSRRKVRSCDHHIICSYSHVIVMSTVAKSAKQCKKGTVLHVVSEES